VKEGVENMLDVLIAACYYLFVAWVVAVMVQKLARTKSWERELLYVIVLLPFVLRLLRLK
jgi:hypothetical protein